MELLGESLENLFQNQKRKFSLKTACMLGIQMIDRVEFIHSKKIIHRDIKPDNFAIGYGNKSHIVYILDFGLSKKYWSSSHKRHIPFIKGKKLTGTARYASINALSGFEQSRRDDLESIGYIIMYFIRGSLPWQGLKINNKENRYKKICEKKKATSAKELCKDFPEEFEKFVDYTRKLQFMEVPDYDRLRNLLKDVIKKSGEVIDFFYDWCTEKPNIKKDDPIYRDNYRIVYNGDREWLNRNKGNNINIDNDEENDKNNKNDDNNQIKEDIKIKSNKTMKSNITNGKSHYKSDSNTFSNKGVDFDGKNNNKSKK